MRIIEALQKIIEKYGGTSPNSVNKADYIDAIANCDILPAVTAADNGKVLTVVNGKWQAVTPD